MNLPDIMGGSETKLFPLKEGAIVFLGEPLNELHEHGVRGSGDALNGASALGILLQGLPPEFKSEVCLLTKLGRGSERIMEVCRTSGVNEDLIIHDPTKPVGRYGIIQTQDGKWQPTFDRANSAATTFGIGDLQRMAGQRGITIEDFIKTRTSILWISGIMAGVSDSCKEAFPHIARIAKQNGVFVVYDPNMRWGVWGKQGGGIEEARRVHNEIVKHTDMIVISSPADALYIHRRFQGDLASYEHEMDTLANTPREKFLIAGALARLYHEMNVPHVVTRMGVDGSFFAIGHVRFIHFGIAEKGEHTTGCGDAFGAAVLACVKNWDRLDNLTGSTLNDYGKIILTGNIATATASIIAQTPGGAPCTATWDKVREQLVALLEKDHRIRLLPLPEVPGNQPQAPLRKLRQF